MRIEWSAKQATDAKRGEVSSIASRVVSRSGSWSAREGRYSLRSLSWAERSSCCNTHSLFAVNKHTVAQEMPPTTANLGRAGLLFLLTTSSHIFRFALFNFLTSDRTYVSHSTQPCWCCCCCCCWWRNKIDKTLMRRIVQLRCVENHLQRSSFWRHDRGRCRSSLSDVIHLTRWRVF